jgi:hypothetical protein
MIEKKLSSIALVTLLMLSMAAIFTVSPVLAAEPYFAIKPEHIINNTPSVGQTFSVWLNISCSVPFVGFQYYIYWNRTYINGTDVTYYEPASFTQKMGAGLQWDFNSSHGRIERGAMDPNLGTITGSYTIAKIDFEIIKVPKPVIIGGDGDTTIIIDLDYDNCFFSDAQANPVSPYYAYDGDVFLKALLAAPPTIYVDPINSTGHTVGEHFTVDIKIRGVEEDHGLWGWEFVMNYNTTLLDTISVTEGSFLKDFAPHPTNGTMFIARFGGLYDPAYINTTYEQEGKIHSACLFVENHTDPTGSGILATITFEVTFRPISPETAWCWLDIFNKTSLADTETWPGPPPGAIPHFSENGFYRATQISLGRKIDSYTDAHRKYLYPYYYTNYTGIGHNMNADAYQPQDLVIIYALVTYGDDPVQHKPVQFEVIAPDTTLEGFPMYRVNLTDENGIATLIFRIPWPCNDPERVMGKWKVYQSVDIACQQVSDTEWFEVAWYIKLTKVMVKPDPVTKYKNGTGSVVVSFEYENHCMTPIDVYFTVVLFDHQMTPIGVQTLTKRVAGNLDSIKCYWSNMTRPRLTDVFPAISIPGWAYVGSPGGEWGDFPAAFVNAYTYRCSYGGMPYCPEVYATFTIAKA